MKPLLRYHIIEGKRDDAAPIGSHGPLDCGTTEIKYLPKRQTECPWHRCYKMGAKDRSGFPRAAPPEDLNRMKQLTDDRQWPAPITASGWFHPTPFYQPSDTLNFKREDAAQVLLIEVSLRSVQELISHTRHRIERHHHFGCARCW
jgi:hypothetical protein